MVERLISQRHLLIDLVNQRVFFLPVLLLQFILLFLDLFVDYRCNLESKSVVFWHAGSWGMYQSHLWRERGLRRLGLHGVGLAEYAVLLALIGNVLVWLHLVNWAYIFVILHLVAGIKLECLLFGECMSLLRGSHLPAQVIRWQTWVEIRLNPWNIGCLHRYLLLNLDRLWVPRQ